MFTTTVLSLSIWPTVIRPYSFHHQNHIFNLSRRSWQIIIANHLLTVCMYGQLTARYLKVWPISTFCIKYGLKTVHYLKVWPAYCLLPESMTYIYFLRQITAYQLLAAWKCGLPTTCCLKVWPIYTCCLKIWPIFTCYVKVWHTICLRIWSTYC